MAKKKYYAWNAYDQGGIEETWEACEAACKRISGEKHKGFKTFEEAWAFAFPGKPLPDDNEKEEEHSDSPQLHDEPEINSFSVPLVNDEGEVGQGVIGFCNEFGISDRSDEQKRAIQSVDGRTLLFAVPGSGKTTVIIDRIGYMIHSLHVPHNQIISLTFTKAAANEMKTRFSQRYPMLSSPDFRTIHSLCFSTILPMLRKAGYPYDRDLLGAEQETENQGEKITENKVFKRVFDEIKCPKNNMPEAIKTAQGVIIAIKNICRPPEDYRDKSIKINDRDINVAQLFYAYERVMKELNLMDYDDLLIQAYKGLREYNSILEDIRNLYKYWNIDEAQDNSKLQTELLNLIWSKDTSVFMVGDDDQSIYSFRGAQPGLLREFGQREDVKTLLISNNYRSDQDIVNASKGFIEQNQNREPKDMNAFRQEPGFVNIPSIFRNEAEQYSYIIKNCEKAIASGEELAILYRRNISSLPLIVYLHRKGIPYEASTGLSELLREKQIRALWNILRFINEPNDWKAFSRAKSYLNIWTNKKEEEEALKELNKKSPFENILDLFIMELERAEEVDDKKLENAKRLKQVSEEVRRMRPSKAVNEIRAKLYSNAIDSISDRLRLYSFLSVCGLYTSLSEFVDDIQAIINSERRESDDYDQSDVHKSLESVVSNKRGDIKPITLSTIHSSKGREFDHVIMIDLFDEIMPGEYRGDALVFDPEEERRLFYVATTRAKHRLDILTVERYHGNLELVSRFVKEFAYSYDFYGNGEQLFDKDEKMDTVDSEVLTLETVFYGVKVGRKPGVYTSWNECRKQVNGYSGPQFKRFSTREAAEEYVGAITDQEEASTYELDDIKKCFVESGGKAFNTAMDLPSAVTNSILRKFGVDSLIEMKDSEIKRLKSQSSYVFTPGVIVDYSKIVDTYVLSYLPVNFYKVWKPLMDLAENEDLPVHCRVLELGVGPGTATLGLISFYICLANSNPDMNFSLDITAVERERGFELIFWDLINNLNRYNPENLSVDIRLVHGDAFKYEDKDNITYQLVLESNMLNASEGDDPGRKREYIRLLKRTMGNNAFAILIEPGKKDNLKYLDELMVEAAKEGAGTQYISPDILATDVTGIKIHKQIVQTGIRNSAKPEHWFSYGILMSNRG